MTRIPIFFERVCFMKWSCRGSNGLTNGFKEKVLPGATYQRSSLRRQGAYSWRNYHQAQVNMDAINSPSKDDPA